MSHNEEIVLSGRIKDVKYWGTLLADLWNAKIKNGKEDESIKALAGDIESQVKIINYEMPVMGNPETGQPIVKMQVRLDERPDGKSTIKIKNGAAELLSWEAKTKSLCFVCLYYKVIWGDSTCFKASNPSKHKKTCNKFTLKQPRT